MGTRAWVVAAVLVAASSAYADPKGDITSKSKEAMENYDLMDYDAAKKLLNQALASAKKAKLDKDPVTARVYLDLGLAAFAGGDIEGAKVAFISAVQIDPKIQIDAAYKSPELTKMLDEAKSGGSAGKPDGGNPEPVLDSVDCTTVKGLQHTIIDTAPSAAPQPIEALVGGDIAPIKVSVFYRVEGATDFTEVKLGKQGDCKYTGAIPAAAMKGSLIHYYVAALDGNNKAIAAKGSSGSPNILELTAAAKKVVGTKDDNEDPIGSKRGGGREAPQGDDHGRRGHRLRLRPGEHRGRQHGPAMLRRELVRGVAPRTRLPGQREALDRRRGAHRPPDRRERQRRGHRGAFHGRPGRSPSRAVRPLRIGRRRPGDGADRWRCDAQHDQADDQHPWHGHRHRGAGAAAGRRRRRFHQEARR
jgi:hypothetical protein